MSHISNIWNIRSSLSGTSKLKTRNVDFQLNCFEKSSTCNMKNRYDVIFQFTVIVRRIQSLQLNKNFIFVTNHLLLWKCYTIFLNLSACMAYYHVPIAQSSHFIVVSPHSNRGSIRQKKIEFVKFLHKKLKL